MKLNQAIGVIMGANIGTTVTSWILSLTGIEGNNLLVTLLKPTSFTPILAIIGIFLIMASKQEKRKDIGAIMIGFAILICQVEQTERYWNDHDRFFGIDVWYGHDECCGKTTC